MPLVGIAGVLTRLGRDADALATYEAALDRAPTDEAALRGRAEPRWPPPATAIGAAETLDRLAAVLDGAGRLADATDAARRALELAESRGRRVTVRQLAERLRAESSDPAAAEALASAMRLLAGPAVVSEPVADGAGGQPTTARPASTQRSTRPRQPHRRRRRRHSGRVAPRRPSKAPHSTATRPRPSASR